MMDGLLSRKNDFNEPKIVRSQPPRNCIFYDQRMTLKNKAKDH